MGAWVDGKDGLVDPRFSFLCGSQADPGTRGASSPADKAVRVQLPTPAKEASAQATKLAKIHGALGDWVIGRGAGEDGTSTGAVRHKLRIKHGK